MSLSSFSRPALIPKKLMADFRNFKNNIDTQLASIIPPVFAFFEKNKDNKKI
jgi:hypothetical protein